MGLCIHGCIDGYAIFITSHNSDMYMWLHVCTDFKIFQKDNVDEGCSQQPYPEDYCTVLLRVCGELWRYQCYIITIVSTSH